MLSLPCMVILAWSELPQPPVPKVCLRTQRSPWAAVCLFSRGLVATAMWLWLTVGLTTPFMRHLLAVNQGGHPGAIDGAVSLCEMCLSKPTHSATLSPCLGSLTFVYCPPFHPSFPSLSISCCFLPLPVSPSSACFPLETRQPLNPWSNHRFFGHTFVILRPSGFCNGVFHKHFCRWLGPDMHVVFIAAPCICVSPVSAECHHRPIHSSLFFPLKFLSILQPPPLLTHPSSLYLTGDKVWASSWLANRRPVIPVNIFPEPCQARSSQTRPSCELTKGTEFCGKWRKCSNNSKLCVDPVTCTYPAALRIWNIPKASSCQIS